MNIESSRDTVRLPTRWWTLVLQPPFNFFPALSLAANVDFGRPKGRSTMMGSPHFLAKVVVTGYRQL